MSYEVYSSSSFFFFFFKIGLSSGHILFPFIQFVILKKHKYNTHEQKINVIIPNKLIIDTKFIVLDILLTFDA